MKSKAVLIIVWLGLAVAIFFIVKNIVNANKIIKESKEQLSTVKV